MKCGSIELTRPGAELLLTLLDGLVLYWYGCDAGICFKEPVNMYLETFDGDPTVVVPALLGDSLVADSLKEFSMAFVIAYNVAGLGRISSTEPSGFNVVVFVVVLVEIDTVGLLVVIVRF